jgi:hypothetical protein
MKTLPSTSSQISGRLRKKRPLKLVPSEVDQILHHLCNQLSVVNLCSFSLRVSLRDAVRPIIIENIEMLERTVHEATMTAEQLAQLIAEPAGLRARRTSSHAKLNNQADNVSALFPPRPTR